ncbi:MAG TPA: class I SAM-dependent methyltransferase [Gemmataceae bacterium]|nr:class I SAM-dependent methyltransferase [Gemmataceae bacterium]
MKLQEVVADVDTECRRRSIPMLGPQKAVRLVEWIREADPGLVVEVGTAIGYSGLWIADLLRERGKGRLLTFELDPERAAEAARNFKRAGVSDLVTQVVGDARERLRDVREPIDVLFLDGGFENYHACFLACRDQLRDGALIVADNAGIGADRMKDYLELVRTNYPSRTEWFETDLAWNPRDAMEITKFVSNEPV